MPSTPNQSNYQTNQNYDIDIKQIYSDFIQEIDSNRSIVNIQVNTTVLNTFDIKTIASLGSSLLKVESTPQESRAHAFYRLIGFPVVDKSGQYYNPGLDNIGGTKKIYLKDKINIANNVDSQFKMLSLKRENYSNTILNIFNQRPVTITSSALALSSSTHTRSFSIPTTNTDPLSFVATDQKYTANLDSIVEKRFVKLTDYVDANGNKPDTSLVTDRYHFIQPFIVDPRIDFTVNPSSRKVAVPFVPTKKNLLVAENTYVKRPLIEKVIRDRFTASQNTTVSSSQQQIIDYILNVPTVKQDSLINQMISDIYNKGTQALFEKYLFIIQAMCIKLVKAQVDIHTAQSRYYWIPAPSSIGPEGGSDIQGIIISQSMSNDLITTRDRSIINLTLSQAANKFDTASSEANGVPDLGGFAFDGGSKFFDLTFDSDTSASLGDIVTSQLDGLNKKRNHDLAIANTALQDIETIMGEWSGLGLCDIIAVMASLYTMDQNSLLGFLDADALSRCEDQLGIDTSAAPAITDTLQTFVQSVNNYYHLMDDIYKNLATSNGLIAP